MTPLSAEESQHLWLSLQSQVMRSCTTAEPARAEAVVTQLLQTVGERAKLAALFLRQKDKPLLHWGDGRQMPETSIGITTFRARVGRETHGIFVVDPGPEQTLDPTAREALQCIGDALAGLLDRELEAIHNGIAVDPHHLREGKHRSNFDVLGRTGRSGKTRS